MPTETDDRTGLLALSHWAVSKACCVCITDCKIWEQKLLYSLTSENIGYLNGHDQVKEKHIFKAISKHMLHTKAPPHQKMHLLWSSSGFLWNRYNPFCTLYTWQLFYFLNAFQHHSKSLKVTPSCPQGPSSCIEELKTMLLGSQETWQKIWDSILDQMKSWLANRLLIEIGWIHHNLQSLTKISGSFIPYINQPSVLFFLWLKWQLPCCRPKHLTWGNR